jgi:protein phosphatase
MKPTPPDQIPQSIQWSGQTDCGKVRKNNEDSFLGLQFDGHDTHRLGKFGEGSLANKDFVFAVSDGMGGALAGEFASKIATEKITTLLPRSYRHSASGFPVDFANVLNELYAQIHRALVYLGRSYDECGGMETTLSLCWFRPGWMYFGHVGDSRIYHLPKSDGTIKQVSEDDTYVGWLVRNGKLNEREARTHPRRNVLQKALGGDNQFVDPQVGAIGCQSGDLFLICSDGLSEGLYRHQLLDYLRPVKKTSNQATAAEQLVKAAVEYDGRDNTTALVIQVK